MGGKFGCKQQKSPWQGASLLKLSEAQSHSNGEVRPCQALGADAAPHQLPPVLHPRFTRAFTETKAFTQHKLTVSAIMAIIVRVAFWGIAQVQLTWSALGHELLRDLLIIVISYAVASAGSCVFNLIRVPALIDADCQSKISQLSEQLALPDKVLAEYIAGLLAQINENAIKILQLALLYDVIESRQMKIDSLSFDDIQNSRQECVSVGLLRVEYETVDRYSPLAIANQRSFYQVPPEFRETLKRLLYKDPVRSNSAIVR